MSLIAPQAREEYGQPQPRERIADLRDLGRR
jgi:hypothetical protein